MSADEFTRALQASILLHFQHRVTGYTAPVNVCYKCLFQIKSSTYYIQEYCI